LEVVKDNGNAIDEQPVVAAVEPISSYVPGPQSTADVLQNVHPREEVGEPVEIRLVAVAVGLNPVVAPFDATLSPPAECGKSAAIATESFELRVVDARARLCRRPGIASKLRCEPV